MKSDASDLERFQDAMRRIIGPKREDEDKAAAKARKRSASKPKPKPKTA